MRRFLSRLFRSSSRPARPKPVRRAQLGLESLEERQLLSGTPSGDFLLSKGTLTIEGTPYADRVTIDYTQGGVFVNLTNQFGGGQGRFFRAGQLSRIVFHGYDGNDKLFDNTSIPVIAYGGNGDDLLVGGSGNDTLYGDAGNDKLYGMDGNDSLYGGSGADLLAGMNGNDYLDGGRDGQADSLYGGAGADTFITYGRYSEPEVVSDFNQAEGDSYGGFTPLRVEPIHRLRF
jgi:Ca2+-binding RTX toxin-like protein